MEHLDFIVWMLGFPVAHATAEWISSLRTSRREEYSEWVEGWVAVILLVMWLGIGAKLW